MSDTIRRLIDPADPAAPAVGAPDRADLAYADLRALIDRTVADLNGFGIGRGDAVAIVLPQRARDGHRLPRRRLRRDGRPPQPRLPPR